MYLREPKAALIGMIMSDWDHKKPLHIHIQEWQDLSDTMKYQLIAEAMGQRFKVKRISTERIRKWMRQLNERDSQ